MLFRKTFLDRNASKGKGMLLIIVLFFSIALPAAPKNEEDKIIGKWVTEKKNLIVEVYKCGNEFKAKVVWFNDRDDRTRPLNARTDYQNPKPALRTRKIVGMDVLSQLTYSKDTMTWENGIIYDSRTGKEWNSCAYMTSDGRLCVKGYWHFKIFGKTMTFHRE